MKLRLYLDIAPWMLEPSAVWSFNAYSHPPVKGEDVVRYAIDVEVPDPNRRGESMIGTIVHYTNLGDRDGKYPPTVQAAIITGVNDDDTVALHVFYKTGQFDLARCEQANAADPAGSEGARGKWSLIL